MAASSTPYSGTNHDLNNIKAKGAEELHSMADKATEQMSQMAGSIEHAAGKVLEQGREAGERVQEVAGNMQDALSKSVRDQPMATIAVIAAAGFVLGALWKS